MATIRQRFYPNMSLDEIKKINMFANNDWLKNGENLTPKRRSDIIRLINNQVEVTSEQIKQKGRNEGRYAAFRAIVHGFAFDDGKGGLIVKADNSGSKRKQFISEVKSYRESDKAETIHNNSRLESEKNEQMILLKEAIEKGWWLKCIVTADRIFESLVDSHLFEEFVFKFKPLSLTKINIIQDVDEFYKLNKIEVGANIWLLKIEFMNLCRKKIRSNVLHESLILMDDEKFEFPSMIEGYLSLYSNYSKTSGLEQFYGGHLPPKIKRRGALVFELPEYFRDLYIGVNFGSIMRV